MEIGSMMRVARDCVEEQAGSMIRGGVARPTLPGARPRHGLASVQLRRT